MLAMLQLVSKQTQVIQEMTADLNTLKRFVFDANPGQTEHLTAQFDKGRREHDEEFRKTLLGLQALQQLFAPRVQ